MPLDPIHFLSGIVVLLGVTLVAVGLYSSLRWDEPGVTSYAVFLGILGIGLIISILSSFVVEPPTDEVAVWPVFHLFFLGIAAVPWIAFSLQYTGHYPVIKTRTIAMLSVPLIGLVPFVGVVIFGDVLEAIGSQVIFSLSLLYAIALVIIGTFLIIWTTYRYGHLSVVEGVTLSAPAILLFVFLNFAPMIIVYQGKTAAIAALGGVNILVLTCLGIAIFHYQSFASTAAVGAIGERAIAREINDLIIVLDDEDCVITINEAATRILGSTDDQLGMSIEDVLGVTLATINEIPTLELHTEQGHAKFDPQVSPLSDQHGRRLGSIVSLRDVTDRELRQERLAVFNRVLRHNHRNQLEVIKANAETLEENETDDHARLILESADKLRDLSMNARSIDHLLSRPLQAEKLDLVAVIHDISNRVEPADGPVEIAYQGPESVSTVTDRKAVELIIENAITNAIRHAETAVSIELTEVNGEFQLRVVDDGSGIPQEEIAALEAGTEHPLQHGTGLGLWIVKWATSKLNGTIDFKTGPGTAVTIRIPAQPSSN